MVSNMTQTYETSHQPIGTELYANGALDYEQLDKRGRNDPVFDFDPETAVDQHTGKIMLPSVERHLSLVALQEGAQDEHPLRRAS